MINKFNKICVLLCCIGVFAPTDDSVCNSAASYGITSDSRDLVMSRSQSGYDGWYQISCDYIQRSNGDVSFIPSHTSNDNGESSKGNSVIPTDHNECCIMHA